VLQLQRDVDAMVRVSGTPRLLQPSFFLLFLLTHWQGLRNMDSRGDDAEAAGSGSAVKHQ
jgi:hypothetical protein